MFSTLRTTGTSAATAALTIALAACSSNSPATIPANAQVPPPANGDGGNSTVTTPTTTANAYLRAIHGSPNAGPVDIYIYPTGTTRPTSPALSNVSYKAISTYSAVAPNSYTIDVLPHGQPCTSTPVASEHTTLAANEHESAVVAGEVPSTLQFVNFIEPAETAGESALIVHHASPFVGGVIQPVGVGIYDAGTISGTPSPSQTTQLFAFSFKPGTSGPATSGNASGGEFFLSPVPTTALPATLGLAAGAPGTTHLASVAVAAPLSAVISGVTGFPPNAHVSLFAIDASPTSATVIGTVDP